MVHELLIAKLCKLHEEERAAAKTARQSCGSAYWEAHAITAVTKLTSPYTGLLQIGPKCIV